MYHYGLSIKEYRELRGLTQAELAEKWVKSDGTTGVTAEIPGVQNAEQVQCNLAVLEQGPLSQELLNQITILWQEDFCRDVRTSVGEEGEGELRKAHKTIR